MWIILISRPYCLRNSYLRYESTATVSSVVLSPPNSLLYRDRDEDFKQTWRSVPSKRATTPGNTTESPSEPEPTQAFCLLSRMLSFTIFSGYGFWNNRLQGPRLLPLRKKLRKYAYLLTVRDRFCHSYTWHDEKTHPYYLYIEKRHSACDWIAHRKKILLNKTVLTDINNWNLNKMVYDSTLWQKSIIYIYQSDIGLKE